MKKNKVYVGLSADILHKGHLELLKFAKEQGDKLIVGINSDASVKRLKGKNRPVNSQEERKSQLMVLPWVDEVIIFDEDTPLEKIKKLKPNLIIKGGDYNIDNVSGNKLAKVIIFPLIKGASTSNTIKKIKS